MVRELNVWFFGECVGVLTQDEGYLSFQYLPEWLKSKNAKPLSQSLPLRAEPFGDKIAKPFFAGLLPEGDKRAAVANILKVSSKNDFALLDGIGGECAGALILLEPGQTPPAEAHASDSIEWLEEDQLLAVLEKLPKRPLLAGESGLRLSLAGAQEKLPVVAREVFGKDGLSHFEIGLPKNNIPSSYILKPEISGVDGSVYNEAFCLALAGQLKLDAATAKIGKIKDKTYLLVERYDRILDGNGQLTRLHQEDFCQALGIAPELKYQNEGGPTIADGFALVRKVTTPSAPNLLRLLDHIIFNCLVGNNDAHAKNFSLLYSQSGIQLAPLYDVLSTAVYPDLSDSMAMKIGSKYRFDELHARHWVQMAEAAQLGAPQLKRRVLEIAGELPNLAKELQVQFEAKGWGHPILAQIVSLIEERCATTANRFSLAE
ncbi:type II toxin-antitoxin system HipA family toxin [Polynucleobacter sp. MWH-Aus1W21]|uniref:type II toxin-antitoxin system HipA family toxin n=1 Tax=Polynucleobacter sp. MWH-Aus1W21 TaxID=1855880 RepID=UPI001BFD6818|nr:type II toxin-antitoxin system HipA family toxin [Polynucleobacter sp. MWH-Aus1W21]QWD67102.1 type II toxin-antitoxin system HipA family toxin [Polynucleobacter sp. MWH-Aus1W21]